MSDRDSVWMASEKLINGILEIRHIHATRTTRACSLFFFPGPRPIKRDGTNRRKLY